MASVLVDTGIFFAIADRDDAWHDRVRAYLETSVESLLVPVTVLPEVMLSLEHPSQPKSWEEADCIDLKQGTEARKPEGRGSPPISSTHGGLLRCKYRVRRRVRYSRGRTFKNS
jgi:hypothetical protein